MIDYSQYTHVDLYKATDSKRWDEVKSIVSVQPELVNEIYRGVPLLFWIVWSDAPEPLLLQSLEHATVEAVDAQNGKVGNRSILQYLADKGRAKALRRALEISTTRVNLQDELGGNTPLHFLLRGHHSFHVHQDSVKALLQAGANSSIKNESGFTPGDWYEQNKCSAYNAPEREEQKDQILQLLQKKIIPMEIKAHGPEALKAFKEALQEGETEVYQARTLFLGLERVGKSSTIDSFLRKPFNPEKDITDAIATTKVCTQDLHNELEWKETAYDHPGVADIYKKGLADSMAIKILKNMEKKEKITSKMNILSKEEKEEEKMRVNIEDKHETDIKRKKKLQTPSVPEHIASEVEERMNAIKFTREGTNIWQKSGNGLNMSIWDFGGQPIYHVIQRIFMASLAVACVVFNLNDDLDAPANVRDPTTGELYKHRMTNLQFILYWIRSVFMNSRESKLDDKQLSPPVLLIGTHLDKLEGNEAQRKNKAEGIFCKIRQALAGKPYEAMVFSTMYAIDNSVPFSKSSASEIMSQILRFTKKMVRCLPLKWLLVQQEIQKLRKKHIYLPTKEIIALLDRCEVKRDAHRVLLEYLHDVGELLYFPDDETLKDIIVLDLMQIVDMFKTVITVINPKLQEPLLKEAWRKLDSGILEEHLLRYLWQKFNLTDETFDFFVHLMQKFGLVCERKISKSERIFYILSRLKPEHVDSLSTEDYGKRAVSIFHDFGGYLPDDLFQRGVTKFIEKFQVEDSEPKLAYEHVELGIHEHHHVILNVATIKHRRMFKMTIIRRKILNTDAEEGEPSPSVCKEVLRFVEAELKLFCQSGARGVELTRYIPCVCSRNMKDAHMHILRNFDKDVLPCGSNGMEVTRYRRLFSDNPTSLQGNSPVLAVTKHEGFVDDAVIATVSEEMDVSWRRFGVRLGLPWFKVNKCFADEQRTEQAIVSMLTYWRDTIDRGRHQLKVLCIALRQHGYVRLAEELYQGDLNDETMPVAIHAGHLADVDMLSIAEPLNDDWKTLGIILGFKRSELREIESCFRLSMVDASIQMLVKWREKQEANVNHLAVMDDALKQLEREDIRVELQTYYQQRYQQQNNELN